MKKIEPEYVCGGCGAPRDIAFDFCRECGSTKVTWGLPKRQKET
jgi:rRNA maturation endonuclease Nob1